MCSRCGLFDRCILHASIPRSSNGAQLLSVADWSDWIDCVALFVDLPFCCCGAVVIFAVEAKQSVISSRETRSNRGA